MKNYPRYKKQEKKYVSSQFNNCCFFSLLGNY